MNFVNCVNQCEHCEFIYIDISIYTGWISAEIKCPLSLTQIDIEDLRVFGYKIIELIVSIGG